MPDDIKTDSRLIARLQKSGQFVTREQIKRQRVSHIYGSLPKESTITRHQIESILDDNGEGVAA
jgi:hypothetical protein